MKLPILILLTILITNRVGATTSPYPAFFPKVSCEKAWKNIKHQYDFQNDSEISTIGNIGYKKYYDRINRKDCYKDWTVLVFMAADNDLSPYALWDIYEMERKISGLKNLGASTAETDVIVEVDTYKRTGVRRLHLFQTNKQYDNNVNREYFENQNELMIDSPIIKFYKEEGRGTVRKQENRLKRFLKQSIRDYPSKHYMVVFWGHGEGYIGKHHENALRREETSSANAFPIDKVFGGYGFDFSELTFLDVPTIREIVDDTMFSLLYDKPVDVIAFDACLMQTIEVVSELKDSADFLIGSTQIQDYLGLPYRMILDELNENDEIEPYEISKIIPKLSRNSYLTGGYQGEINPESFRTFTASAISTKILKHELLPRLMELATNLKDYLEEVPFRLMNINSALNNSPAFPGETRDFGIFLGLIEQMLFQEKEAGIETEKSRILKNSITKLWKALGQTMFANEYGTLYTDQTLENDQYYLLGFFKGISVWLPSNKELFDHRIKEFADSKLFRGKIGTEKPSAWQEILELIYSKGGGGLPPLPLL